jgi:hypothetical protein
MNRLRDRSRSPRPIGGIAILGRSGPEVLPIGRRVVHYAAPGGLSGYTRSPLIGARAPGRYDVAPGGCSEVAPPEARCHSAIPTAREGRRHRPKAERVGVAGRLNPTASLSALKGFSQRAPPTRHETGTASDEANLAVTQIDRRQMVA